MNFLLFSQNKYKYRVFRKKLITECYWGHSARAQSPGAGTPCFWRCFLLSFFIKTKQDQALPNMRILTSKSLRNPILHAPKACSVVHWLHICFCFCSTTFPSHVGTFGQRLQVLHCKYNHGDGVPKFDLVIILDWGVVLI